MPKVATPVNRLEAVERNGSVVDSLARIRVEITGMPPGLLFQGKGCMEAQGSGPSKPKPPEEEARLRAHWIEHKGKKPELCIPWQMMYRSICKAGGSFKFKNKKTYESVLAPTLTCEQDRIPLGLTEFETFIEYVKIPPRTGAMVKIGRPLMREWSCEFVMLADAETYDPSALKQILVEAGKNVGIGAWRPQLKGPYGKFRLVGFEII